MKNGEGNGGAAASLFVLGLLGLFAVLSVALIAFGVMAYRSTAALAQENANARVSVGYVLSNVHAYEGGMPARVETFNAQDGAVDVLVLAHDYDGERYEQRIYCAQGALREQFVSADIPLEDAQDGETVCALQAFEAQAVSQGLMRLTFTAENGTVHTVHAAIGCAPESGEGAQ